MNAVEYALLHRKGISNRIGEIGPFSLCRNILASASLWMSVSPRHVRCWPCNA